MKQIRIAIAIAFVFAAGEARADTLVLNDGQTLEGVVVEKGDTVEVRLEFGTVSFPRSEVKAVERGTTKLHELEERVGQLRAGDKGGALALAKWAEDNGLAHGARDLYRRVLRIDPNDAQAHRALGHRQHEGRWLTEEDYLRATGKVRYGGRWVTTEQAAKLEAEADKRRERAEARRKREALAAETRRLKAKQARLERRVEELEEEQDGGFNWGWGWWGTGRVTNLRPYMNGYNLPRKARKNYRVGAGVKNRARLRPRPRVSPRAPARRPARPARPSP